MLFWQTFVEYGDHLTLLSNCLVSNYYINIQQTFRGKVTKGSQIIVPNLWRTGRVIHKLIAKYFVSNFKKTFGVHGERFVKYENVFGKMALMWFLTLSSLNLPVSSSSTTSREVGGKLTKIAINW